MVNSILTIWAAGLAKRFFGHNRTVWSGPSLSANRIIGHYRLCPWKANARMRLRMRGMNVILCILRIDWRHIFAWRGPFICLWSSSSVVNLYSSLNKSADDKVLIFFSYISLNRFWHSMQIVSIGDNLHGMSNPVYGKNKKNISKCLLKILPRVLSVNRSLVNGFLMECRKYKD